MSKKRFEEEMKISTDAKKSRSTIQATKHAVKIFRTYLSGKGVNTDFENFSTTELTECLGRFYAELRNKDGGMYKYTSLKAVRSGLRRVICQTNNIDIVGDPRFTAANQVFTCMRKEAHKNGRGSVDHKHPLEKSDIEKLYGSVAFDINAPTGLLNKVWFELSMYFGHRGRENQRDLTADMFDIATDANGKRYVYQTQSGISKNQQGVCTSEICTKHVRMYETQSTMCPVKSFEKYLSKRNPQCEALFQAPRDSFLDSDRVWFENRSLGKNKLGNKMKDLAHQAQLSYPYTNHCIWATYITALSHAGFEARHIMTASGHQNEASFKSDCLDTTTTQKQQMSAVISSLTHDSTNEDENCEDDFKDGVNDILALSQQTILTDISNYEAIDSSTGTFSDKGGSVPLGNVPNAMQLVKLETVSVLPPVNEPNAMQPVQFDPESFVPPVNVPNAMQHAKLETVSVPPPVNVPNAMQPVQKDNKRSRSNSPAGISTDETDVPEKKRKLDVPVQYKTYMPPVEPTAVPVRMLPTRGTIPTTVLEPTEHGARNSQQIVEKPKENTSHLKVSAESFKADLKKTSKPTKLPEPVINEDFGKRSQRQTKSEYHWSEDATCEVILTYDGISERRKLKPALSSVVQSLVRGKYSVLRPDLHQSLSMEENYQTNQELVNSLNYRVDDNKPVYYLNDAKTEIFKVLSTLCMSKARFKDLLDWMKTLKLEEGNQGKFYLSERNVIGSGLRVVYDSDEQTAAKLSSLHRARAKAKEKTKLLYPVTPLQHPVNAVKTGDKQFMVMVPSSSTASAVVTDAKSTSASKAGEPAVTMFPTIPPGQTLVPVTLVPKDCHTPHPAWSKEVLNKATENPTTLVSLLSTSSKSVTATSSSSSTQTTKSAPRHPNILRSKNRPIVQKPVPPSLERVPMPIPPSLERVPMPIPPSEEPVPMRLFRSYRTEKDVGNLNVNTTESAEKEDSDILNNVIIKQEPLEYDGDNSSDKYSRKDPPDKSSEESDDSKLGVIIKTEPFDYYGT